MTVKDDVLALAERVGLLELALTLANDENAVLAAENTALKAQLEPARVMSVGAVVGAQCHTIGSFTTLVGSLGVRRYFNGGDFEPITNNPTVKADLGKWDRLISYKATAVNETRLLACLDSIPNDGRRTVLMCQNEPERSDKTDFATPAAWRTYVNTFIELVVAWADVNNRPDVMPGWSFSYWRPLTDPTISEWWPTCPNRARAVFGCQSYDPLNRKTLEAQTKTPVDRWRAAAGTTEASWMMSEVATHRTGADGRDWIVDGFRWAASYGCLFAAYYDDVVGKDGPWCVVDAGQIAGLKAVMPAITA